jgi:hypothetical protein
MSQPSGADRMFANMLEFLRARTWEGSLLILRAHPELMNDAGYAVLGLIASDPEMASFIYPQLDRDERESLIQRHYALLGRSREVGPLPAFVELVHDVTMRKWAVALALELADAAGGASSTPTLAIPGPGGTPQGSKQCARRLRKPTGTFDILKYEHAPYRRSRTMARRPPADVAVVG